MLRHGLLLLAGGLVACSPSLNWREVDGVAEQRWWFPCKPERIERQVSLEGRLVPARLVVCDAQGATWSRMALQFPSPADAAQALIAARASLRANLQARETAAPNGLVTRGEAPLWLAGRRAGGAEVVAAARFSVQGRWLVQQVAMAEDAAGWPRSLDGGALDVFFDGTFARP